MKLDAYEEALIEIAREISHYLQKSGVNRADADDISQDLFVKLLESEITLPFEKLRAWMYRTAIRAYIDHYRRDKTYQDILRKEFFTKESLTTFDTVDTSQLDELIETLPESSSQVIDLYYYQGFTLGEIAELLHIRTSTAKMRLSRARKHLKEKIEQRGLNHENLL